MSLALLQDKLNVTDKSRSNLFNWRGQFTPEFVDYLLHHFARVGDLVIDPFSGSGTVLQGAAAREFRAAGFEINPSAYAMSKFFTFATLTIEERTELIQSFSEKLQPVIEACNGEAVFTNNKDYRLAYSNLLDVGANMLPNLTKAERVLLLNALFLSERDKRLLVRESIRKSIAFIKEALLNLPITEGSIEAHLCDARHVNLKLHHCVDLILTSPPYINVFNYHQNYRAIVEMVGFDLLKVANSEFGSNRKNRGNRFRTVIQYSLDMEQALTSFWESLKPGGFLILILGKQSSVRGIPFLNGKLIVDILLANGGFSKIDVLGREFVNKFGMSIKEDILVYERAAERPRNGGARQIAKQHLQSNLFRELESEVRTDLADAIDNIDQISASPIFNPKTVVTHA